MASMREKTKAEGHKDYISSLSDDILILILSLLSLKEAASTSTLSRRWQNLWTSISRLDFDNEMAGISSGSSERPRFINWVNNVMKKYKGKQLDYLRICFDLDDSLKSDIDNWFMFASALRVTILKLDFWTSHIDDYSFPQIKPCMFNTLDFLETLSLKFVKLSEEALECLLSCCPVLQSLSLCGEVGNLKFSGSSLMLKYLDIVLYMGLNTIEISDLNLVSFSYRGPLSALIIKNVPKLEKISIEVSRLENRFLDMLSSCLGLRSLVLDLYMYMDYLDLHISNFVFPEFRGIKELTLGVDVRGDDFLLGFTSLVEACPSLSSFVLQLNREFPFSKKSRKVNQAASKHAHPNLKFVEIRGYYGHKTAAELAIYFFENAINLQKMVIDPHQQEVLMRARWVYGEYDFVLGRSRRLIDKIDLERLMQLENNKDDSGAGHMVSEIEKAEKNARIHAKRQLVKRKPSTVQLVIL